MTDTSTASVDPAVMREVFLDAVFSAAASIGAVCGFSGRTLYESLAPLAEEAGQACVAAAAGANAQGDGAGVDE